MSRTREELRRRKAQRIVQGVSFALILIVCICLPGWAEHFIQDTPAGIYAEMSE